MCPLVAFVLYAFCNISFLESVSSVISSDLNENVKAVFGASVWSGIVCVVLTGMGADGTEGITNLKSKKKVHVISQDEQSCVVYGMPRSIVEAGVVDQVNPISEIARTIIKNVGVR